MAKKSGNVPVRKAAKPEAGSTEVAVPGWPGRAIQNLRDEIDRLFEDFSFGTPLMPRWGRHIFDIEPFKGFERALAPITMLSPSVDVSETDKELTITAELPGLAEKDIEVTLSDDMLTIKGEKKEEEEEKKKDYYLMERRFGAFQRSFRLPDTVDKDKIDAAFKNGVLTITMPKTGKARAAQKKIKIKAK